MTIPQWVENASLIGLLFDICGAIFLGRGIFFNSIQAIALQSETFFDSNQKLRLALCEQRIDALFGLPLLVAGFALQALGIVCSKTKPLLVSSTFLLLVVISVGYVVFRNVLAVKLHKRVNELENELRVQSTSSDAKQSRAS